MTALAILFTMASLGLSETAYLIRKRKASELPVCPIGEDCVVVLNSRYNKFLGVHNEYLGFVFYAVVSLIAVLLVVGVGPRDLMAYFAKIMIFGASFASLLLLYIQWRVLKAWCFWCVMSAITIFVMALVVLTNNITIL